MLLDHRTKSFQYLQRDPEALYLRPRPIAILCRVGVLQDVLDNVLVDRQYLGE